MTNITIEQIASFLAFLVGLIGGIEFLLARLKKCIKSSLNDEFKSYNNVLLDLLRTEMMEIYYEYKDNKKIPLLMKKQWNLCFDTYTGKGGNSFIIDLKKEIDTWEVV